MQKTWSDIEEVPYWLFRSSDKFQGHKGWKNYEFDLNWAFPDYNSSCNSQMAIKWCTMMFCVVIPQISRSHGSKDWLFGSSWSKITRPVAAIKFLRYALFILQNKCFLSIWWKQSSWNFQFLTYVCDVEWNFGHKIWSMNELHYMYLKLWGVIAYQCFTSMVVLKLGNWCVIMSCRKLWVVIIHLCP